MRNKGWLVALLLAAVAFIPLVTKNHIYTGIVTRSDYGSFIPKINAYVSGQPVDARYPAEVIIGRSIAFASEVTKLDVATLYSTFVFLSLIITGFVVYLFGSLFGKRTAWIMVFIALLSTTSVLSLFSYGVIANIINMYVLLLLSAYFLVRWLDGGKLYLILLSGTAFSMFSLFHFSSLYFPYMGATMLVALLIAMGLFKAKVFKLVIVLVVAIAINVVISQITLSPTYSRLASASVAALVGGNPLVQLNFSPLSAGDYLVYFLGWSTLGISVITAGFTPPAFWRSLAYKEKVALFLLGGMAIPLYVGTFTRLSPDSVRSALDASTLTAMAIALMFGKSIEQNNWLLKAGGYILIGFGSLSALMGWVV